LNASPGYPFNAKKRTMVKKPRLSGQNFRVTGRSEKNWTPALRTDGEQHWQHALFAQVRDVRQLLRRSQNPRIKAGASSPARSDFCLSGWETRAPMDWQTCNSAENRERQAVRHVRRLFDPRTTHNKKGCP
jgi:hypothetical protein